MKKVLSIVLVILMSFCLTVGAFAENSEVKAPAAQTEAAQEEKQIESEAAAATVAATTAPEQTQTEDKVEDPDFAGTSDPLSTLRLVLAAVGAFAIAFMYSRSQRSKYRARNKKR